MKLSNEFVGAFIDAIYAVAITMLALEIPGSAKDGDFSVTALSNGILEYVLAFGLLFAFWAQHRRINTLSSHFDRTRLWMHAGIMLLVCLLPRATTLVNQLGADVTVLELGRSVVGKADWTTAEAVDLFYLAVVLGIDLMLLLLVTRAARMDASEEARKTRRAKLVMTAVVIVMAVLSVLTPIKNRYFMAVIPLMLLFEPELVRLVEKRR